MSSSPLSLRSFLCRWINLPGTRGTHTGYVYARRWNVKKTHEGIIEDLEGDITCIQGASRSLRARRAVHERTS